MKKFVNFRFVVLFALVMLANVVAYGQDNVIDEVVWVVGDEAILKSEVEEARLSALYEGRKIDGDPYCVIPEELAVQKLFLHQARLDSIDVPESEVIQRVDAMTNHWIQMLAQGRKWRNISSNSRIKLRHRYVKLCVRMRVKDLLCKKCNKNL